MYLAAYQQCICPHDACQSVRGKKITNHNNDMICDFFDMWRCVDVHPLGGKGVLSRSKSPPLLRLFKESYRDGFWGAQLFVFFF